MLSFNWLAVDVEEVSSQRNIINNILEDNLTETLKPLDKEYLESLLLFLDGICIFADLMQNSDLTGNPNSHLLTFLEKLISEGTSKGNVYLGDTDIELLKEVKSKLFETHLT